MVTITLGTTVVWTNRTQETMHLVSGELYHIYLPLVLKNAGESSGQTTPAPEPLSQAETRLTTSEISGTLAPGESYTHTFTTGGDYPYFVAEYLDTVGTVTVLDYWFIPHDVVITQPRTWYSETVVISGTLVVTDSATLTLAGEEGEGAATITATNIIVAEGATISADGQGYGPCAST